MSKLTKQEAADLAAKELRTEDGSVFSDWEDLMHEQAEHPDDKLVFSPEGAVTIPPGDYDMTNIEMKGDGSKRARVSFADGAKLRNLRTISGNIQLHNSAKNAAPIIVAPAQAFTFVEEDYEETK